MQADSPGMYRRSRHRRDAAVSSRSVPFVIFSVHVQWWHNYDLLAGDYDRQSSMK